MKTTKELERNFKGAANHRRLEILFLLVKKPGLSLVEIADELRCNMKTISEHTHRLVTANLVVKRYQGREVEHRLSEEGKRFIDFAHTL